MNQIKHVYVIPRWAGSSQSDWYPWLKQQLEAADQEDHCHYAVHPLDMPDWSVPTLEQATTYLAELLPPERLAREQVYLVGHSVGCLAILHYLSQLCPATNGQPRVAGVLCVAGWFSIDNPWQDILNWIDAPVNYECARRAIPEDKLIVLLSDDDPYTTGYQQNQKLWLERLRARVHILAGRQHFSEALDTDVRDAIRDLAGAFDELPMMMPRRA